VNDGAAASGETSSGDLHRGDLTRRPHGHRLPRPAVFVFQHQLVGCVWNHHQTPRVVLEVGVQAGNEADPLRQRPLFDRLRIRDPDAVLVVVTEATHLVAGRVAHHEREVVPPRDGVGPNLAQVGHELGVRAPEIVIPAAEVRHGDPGYDGEEREGDHELDQAEPSVGLSPLRHRDAAGLPCALHGRRAIAPANSGSLGCRVPPHARRGSNRGAMPQPPC